MIYEMDDIRNCKNCIHTCNCEGHSLIHLISYLQFIYDPFHNHFKDITVNGTMYYLSEKNLQDLLGSVRMYYEHINYFKHL